MEQYTDIQVDQLPLRVASIHVEGVSYTARQLPVSQLNILNSCRSFAQLNNTMGTLVQNMMATGLYEDVQFSVLPGDDATREFNSDVSVFCEIKERNRWKGSVGLDQAIDGATTMGTITGSLLNPINGFGEELTLGLSRNTQGSVNGASLYLRNVLPHMDSQYKYHVGVERAEASREWISGFTQHQDRVVVGQTTHNGAHTLEYELALRRAIPITLEPEPAVIAQTYQPNLKSTIRYISTQDGRDVPHDPRTGQFIRVVGELSGLIGDYSGAKVEGAWQHHQPLHPDYPLATLSCTFRGGFQQPFRNVLNMLTALSPAAYNASPDSSGFDPDAAFPDVPIYDRFFASSNFTRGLTVTDLGAKSGKHSFGADTYASVTVSASTSIKDYEDLPIKPHIFFNATHLTSLSTLLRKKYGGRTYGVSQGSQFSASVGAGVVFPIVFGRIEVNLASQFKKYGLMKPKFGFAAAVDW